MINFVYCFNYFSIVLLLSSIITFLVLFPIFIHIDKKMKGKMREKEKKLLESWRAPDN